MDLRLKANPTQSQDTGNHFSEINDKFRIIIDGLFLVSWHFRHLMNATSLWFPVMIQYLESLEEFTCNSRPADNGNYILLGTKKTGITHNNAFWRIFMRRAKLQQSNWNSQRIASNKKGSYTEHQPRVKIHQNKFIPNEIIARKALNFSVKKSQFRSNIILRNFFVSITCKPTVDFVYFPLGARNDDDISSWSDGTNEWTCKHIKRLKNYEH